MKQLIHIEKNGKIYIQIYSQLKEKIEKGELKGKLPPVRKLADQTLAKWEIYAQPVV